MTELNQEFVDKLITECGGEPWSRAPMRAITGTAFTPEGLNKLITKVATDCAIYCMEVAQTDEMVGEDYMEGARQSGYKIAAIFGINLSAIGIAACEKCGCTDDNACQGGCFWIQPGLCSACACEGQEVDERLPHKSHPA